MPYDIVQELRPILDSRLMRIAAYIFLRKDKDGKLSALEGGNLTAEDEVVEIDAIMAILSGLSLGESKTAKIKDTTTPIISSKGYFEISDKDIHKIGEKLLRDSSALIVLIEHLWGKTERDNRQAWRSSR